MYRKIVILIISFMPAFFLRAQENYGLTFNSFNAPQENRTSLQIGEQEPVCLGESMDLSFDFYFIPNRTIYFGYLFRMINNSGQNIDLLYNQKNLVFNTVVGETFTSINFNLDSSKLYRNWTNIRYLVTGNTLSLFLNNKLYKTINISLKDKCFRILFGANDMHEYSTTDVPPIVLRNITIKKDDKPKYFWSLNNGSSAQNSIKDSIAGKIAVVKNPVWSASLHQKWQLLKSFNVAGNASIAYNPDAEDLYVVSNDSVFKLPVSDIMSAIYSLRSNNYKLFQGNQSIYNTIDNSLYNFYIDIKNISRYSSQSHTWDKKIDSVLPTEYGHTNRVFVKEENALYIFGGYGQLRYKNQVQRYTFTTKKWEDVAVNGYHFTPRYMATAGKSGNHIYILGGYGSHSGDQLLNPGYLYDLVDYNIQTHTFKKVYTLPDPDSSFVFAGSMYIDSASRCFYALCFDRSRYDTKLRLIKGSLDHPEYEFLGTDIPYSFHDVVSDADLFYSPGSSQLIAVTQLVDLDKRTTINIYGIAFQPVSLSAELASNNFLRKYLVIGLAALTVLIFLVSVFIILKKKRVKVIETLQPEIAPGNHIFQDKLQQSDPNQNNNRPLFEFSDKIPTEAPFFLKERENTVQVYLFGNFEIFDNEGNKISNEFSPLLRELFLILLLNTVRNGRGVTTEMLNEIFWGNKPDKNAKNNLSVNIVRLKNILSKVDAIHIVKNGEYWDCECNYEKVSIDLADFMKLRSVYPNEHGSTYVDKMLYFVSRGAFLKQLEYGWLDNIKADINNKIIDELTSEVEHLDPQKDAEYIIEAANCIFNFDFLNETALRYKCKTLDKLGRHSIAKSTYERFAKEYLKSYGEEFPVSFNEVLK